MRPMSDERAIENAIVSTQMEGFEVTESDRKLLMKIIKKEIQNTVAWQKMLYIIRNQFIQSDLRRSSEPG